MTPEERTLLTGFFDRLGQAPAGDKDAEADGLIREAVGHNPDLAYRMAQTALVYEHGLAAAQEQIRQLQTQVRDLQARSSVPATTGGGSFLGSVPRVPLPGADQAQAAAQQAPQTGDFGRGSFGRGSFGRGSFGRGGFGGGQSFLGSAMSTALGVAGGMALFSGLEHMFSGGAAEAMPQDAGAAAAGPWGAPDPAGGTADGGMPASYDQAAAEPASYDQGGFDDGGGYDDGGLFDGGGFDDGGFDL